MKVKKYTIEFTSEELWDFHSMTEFLLLIEPEFRKHADEGFINKVKTIQKELDELL